MPSSQQPMVDMGTRTEPPTSVALPTRTQPLKPSPAFTTSTIRLQPRPRLQLRPTTASKPSTMPAALLLLTPVSSTSPTERPENNSGSSNRARMHSESTREQSGVLREARASQGYISSAFFAEPSSPRRSRWLPLGDSQFTKDTTREFRPRPRALDRFPTPTNAYPANALDALRHAAEQGTENEKSPARSRPEGELFRYAVLRVNRCRRMRTKIGLLKIVPGGSLFHSPGSAPGGSGC
jgi:hypothetical protein